MIPPKIILTNRSAFEASFIGYAKSVLAELNSSLNFQGLQQGTSEVSPNDGVLIEVAKHFSLETIRITVDESSYLQEENVKDKKEIGSKLDNRFFVRVGKSSDVDLDELGHVTRDDTRYYWIDFFYNTEAPAISDQIAFYETGELYGVVETDDTIYYNESRNVSDETFLQAVTMLDYMFFNYTRSFDMEAANPTTGIIKKDRFVAGYNFLSVGDNIIYAPIIPLPGGGEWDYDAECSKNPQNRFFVDLESRTLCWYHVIQKWLITEPITHTEATGSMAGGIAFIDISTDGDWEVSSYTTFSITGDVGDDYSITTTGSDSLREPIGILSDITELNRSGISLTLPLESTPLNVVCVIDSGVNVDSCTASGSMSTFKCVSNGYSQYTSAEYVYESGELDDILKADTAIDNSYTVDDCGSTPPACPSYDVYEVWEDGTDYYETHAAWSELLVRMSIYGIDAAGYTDVLRGRKSGQYVEECYTLIHWCHQQSGYCATRVGSLTAARSITASVTGGFGLKQDVQIPMQNVVLLDSTLAVAVNTTIERRVTGPSAKFVYYDMAQTFANWSVDNPFYLPPPSPYAVSTITYPYGYTIEDPANILPLDDFPVAVPPLEAQIASSIWAKTSTHNINESTDNDLCVIYECPDTFTASGILTVGIFDDRWSEGSQGIVIAVRSSVAGQTEIYHDGVAKLSAILTALSRDGLIGAEDQLFDIGLI